MQFLLLWHGQIRWLVVGLGVVLLFRSGWGWWRKRPFTASDQFGWHLFWAALDVNFFFGLGLLFGLGRELPVYRLEHALTLATAVLLAHSASRWQKVTDSRRKFAYHFFTLLGSLGLIGLGILRLSR